MWLLLELVTNYIWILFLNFNCPKTNQIVPKKSHSGSTAVNQVGIVAVPTVGQHSRVAGAQGRQVT